MSDSTKATFIVLSFGENQVYHLQAHMALLSAKKFSSEKIQFVVYTDSPQFYRWLDFALVREVSRERVVEWIDKYDYFYRVKIMAMIDAAKKDDHHLIYIDTDVIINQNLESLIVSLSAGNSHMHCNEGLLVEDHAVDKKDMWERVKNKKYANILIDEKTCMWNSGLIALNSKEKLQLLNKTLEVNDQFCIDGIECRVKEQFAFGVVLNGTSKLKEAREWAIHYWGNKEEWSEKISTFLSRELLKGHTALEAANEIDIKSWEKLPINRHQRSWNKKFHKWANSLWPDSLTFFK